MKNTDTMPTQLIKIDFGCNNSLIIDIFLFITTGIKKKITEI